MTRYRIVSVVRYGVPAWQVDRQGWFWWHSIGFCYEKQECLDIIAHLRNATEYYPPLEAK